VNDGVNTTGEESVNVSSTPFDAKLDLIGVHSIPKDIVSAVPEVNLVVVGGRRHKLERRVLNVNIVGRNKSTAVTG